MKVQIFAPSAIVGYHSSPDSGFAFVLFENVDSATTALMLDGGVIFERPIEIRSHHSDLANKLKNQKPVSENNDKASKITGAHSKTSVIASLKSAGYNVGTKAIVQARAFDETHLAGKVGEGIKFAKDKVMSAKESVMNWWNKS